MTIEDIKKMKNATVETFEDGTEKVTLSTTDGGFVNAEFFISFFDGAELTYDSLYNHQKCTPRWKEILYEWKEKGYVN